MRVALTGGIASGKSTAADELRRQGVAVIDYDELARDVVAPGTRGLEAVKRAFGPGVVAPDGSLDRAVLGQVVFDSPESRRRLEAIVHPLVFQAAARAEDAFVTAGHDFVVHEIPLLVEDMDPADFDGVVVVDAPAWMRATRLVRERGLTQQQAADRLAAQVTDEERRSVADFVWDGSRTPDALRAQVDDWVELMRETSDYDAS